jgi:hypothetical protein
MARPKQAVTRDQKVTLRLTAEELIALQERAAKSHQTITDYGRAQMLTKRGRPKGKKSAKAMPGFFIEPDLFHELRKIGVNLNQLAKHCNTHQVPPPVGFDNLVRNLLGVLNNGAPLP